MLEPLHRAVKRRAVFRRQRLVVNWSESNRTCHRVDHGFQQFPNGSKLCRPQMIDQRMHLLEFIGGGSHVSFYPFSIRTTLYNSPFPKGTSISSTSRYPRALYNATPVSVAPISSFLNPAALAADSQASNTRVPIPRRAHSGCTKNARIFAASRSGSSSESSLPAQWSAPNSVFRLLHPPHATMVPSTSATKYVASAISWVSMPKTDTRALSLCDAV